MLLDNMFNNSTASNHYQKSNDQIAATSDKTINVLPILLVAACQPPSTAERLSPTASRTLHEELPPLTRVRTYCLRRATNNVGQQTYLDNYAAI